MSSIQVLILMKSQAFEMLLTQAFDKIRAKARFVDADREALLQWARRNDHGNTEQ
jgi:hypothetical protein